jgi:hypothetical protein
MFITIEVEGLAVAVKIIGSFTTIAEVKKRTITTPEPPF